MGIVTWIVFGLFVGVIARLLVPGRTRIGIAWTIILGVSGAVLGGLFATEVLDIGDGVGDFGFASFVFAVGASLILLSIFIRVDRMLPDRGRDRA